MSEENQTLVKRAGSGLQHVTTRGAPSYLRVDPETGVYYYDMYRHDRRPRRCRGSTKQTNYDRAKKVAEQIIGKWLGADPVTGGKLRVRFSDLCQEYMDKQEKRHRLDENHRDHIRIGTLKQMRTYAGRLLPAAFGHLCVDDISCGERGDWERFVEKHRWNYRKYLAAKNRGEKHPIVARTLFSHAKHMESIMQFAIDKGYRTKPWTASNPDPKPKEQRKLSKEEVNAIISSCIGPSRVQVVMAATMGMRLREILRQQIEWSRHSPCPSETDFCFTNMARGTVSVCSRHAKTSNSVRTITLSPQAKQMIEEWLAHRAMHKRRFVKRDHSVFLFPMPENPERHVEQNKSAWDAAKKRAGIQGSAKFHLLRHYFLSEAAKVADTKQSIVKICQYAGLTTKVFEDVYLHLTAEDTAGASELVVVSLDSNFSFTGEKTNVSESSRYSNNRG